ncbi:phage baseplate assembly protein V [Actinopolymorpha alba]|uniref:phage baseplate assembly protein V n=1 Tax=Actinopolymorpha alba TaxID=533267 RepID=UPI000370C62E|nr:phage baseplate assembly protein V [Actinopolymorpha alba]
MSSVVDTIRAIVRYELASVRITELGLVDAIYPHHDGADDENYGVDVTLRNSGLALKRVPLTTDRIGTVAIPNVGDLVLVAFDQGDVNHPIVLGRLYNDADRPPLSTTDEVVFRLPLAEADDRSVLAAIRNHADADPRRELIVEMPPKITVRVVDGVVTATAGATELKLDQSGSSGGTVTVTAGRSTITMNQDGDVVLDSAASVGVRAAQDLTLEANGSITIRAGTNATVEAGARATVKGNLQASLEGAAAAQVQGATVTVKGMTNFTP